MRGNRAPIDRRITKRAGSFERRGSQWTRSRRPKKAVAKLAAYRKRWKELEGE